MAWTQTDIDNLKNAINSGASEVRYSDGRSIRYRTMDEMKALLALMQNDVAKTTGQAIHRQTRIYTDKGFGG